MTFDVRLIQDPDAVTSCAAAIAEGAAGLHAGLAYRGADNGLKVLHLAMHHRLRCDEFLGWVCIEPAIDAVDLQVLAGFCATLARVMPVLPYGLRFASSRFDAEGRFVPGPSETGLTCSTFLLALFDWAQIPLLDAHTWRERAGDDAVQGELVRALRLSGAAPKHVAAVEAERGCVRYRPEEVAGATTSASRPVAFEDATKIGTEVLAAFANLHPARRASGAGDERNDANGGGTLISQEASAADLAASLPEVEPASAKIPVAEPTKGPPE